MLTRADPHTNLLRSTIAAFAAGTGGADSVTVLPHTVALGPADAEARALARNIQHLLIDEANVHRVADPAAGSGAVEALTEELAERAWAEFQAIEHEGGIVASLLAGAFQSRIANARAALVGEVRSGAAPLIGATVYREPQAGSADAPHPAETLAVRGLAPIRLEALPGAA
jgi:methylmalonyl-CoA mutase